MYCAQWIIRPIVYFVYFIGCKNYKNNISYLLSQMFAMISFLRWFLFFLKLNYNLKVLLYLKVISNIIIRKISLFVYSVLCVRVKAKFKVNFEIYIAGRKARFMGGF